MPHPYSILVRKTRHEEDSLRRAAGCVDCSIVFLLCHSKEVVDVAFLPVQANADRTTK